MIRTAIVPDIKKPETIDIKLDSWSDLVDFFETAAAEKYEYQSSADLPAFTVGYRKRGADGRKKSNYEGAYLVVYDFDGVPEEDAVDFCAKLHNAGYNHFRYSSYRNGVKDPEKGWRGRVVLALDVAAPEKQLAAIHTRLLKTYGSPALIAGSDSAGAQIAHNFALPATRADRANSLFIDVYSDGHRVPRNQWMAPLEVEKPGAPEEALRQVTIDMLRSNARAELAKTNGNKPACEDILTLCDDRPFGGEGDRNDRGLHVVKLIADWWPDADPDHLEEIFSDVVDEFMGEDFPSEWSAMLHKHLGQPVEGTQRVLRSLQTQNIVQTWAQFGIDRDTPYTTDELVMWAAQEGVDVEQFKKRLILQLPKSYLIWANGQYTEAAPAQALTLARQYLALCCDWGVDLGTYRKKQYVEYTMQQLVDRYGTSVNKLQFSMSHERYEYEPQRSAVVLPTCKPRTDLCAEYSAEVEGWLRRLVSEADYPQLEAWLSWTMDLSRPCRLLYLAGGRKVGKSLFFTGCARVWTKMGHIPLGEAVARFNSGLTDCPVLVADEQMPDSLRKGFTGELRELVTKTRWRIDRKNLTIAPLIGSGRIILTANNKNLITTKEHLNHDDIEAMGERILFLRCRDDAREYLENLGDWDKVNELFIEKDAFAKHIMWLNKERRPPAVGRFLVGEGTENVVDELSLSSGWREGLFEWITGYLAKPELLTIDSSAGKPLVYADEKLWVMSSTVSDSWVTYCRNGYHQGPTPSAVGRELTSMVDVPRRRFAAVDGSRPYYRMLDMKLLRTWCGRDGRYSWEELKQKMRVLS